MDVILSANARVNSPEEDVFLVGVFWIKIWDD